MKMQKTMKHSITDWAGLLLGGAALVVWLALASGCGGGGGGGGRTELYFKAPNTNSSDNFGARVALSADGNTMVVGAYGESSSAKTINGDMTDNNAGAAGAAYIYVRDPASGVWTFQSYLKAANADAGDDFGIAVAISDDGNTVAVGAHYERSNATGVNDVATDNSRFAAGAAYVFVRSGTAWSQQAYVKASNTELGDSFGRSVALSGDGNTLAVGATFEDSNGTTQANNALDASGAVYVYSRSGSVWSSQAYLKATTPTANEYFGWSVALSQDGNRVVVGAPQYYMTSYGSGAAYVAARSGTTWGAPVKLAAAHGDSGDQFGQAVAISGDGLRVAIGAFAEGSGIAADETDNSKLGSGAVNLFAESGGSWSQEKYLKASNLDVGDSFGISVRLNRDGSVLAVGAFSEKSKATGIDGDQSDNSLTTLGAGAAYTFERTGSTWTQTHYVKATNTDDGDSFGFSVAISGDGKTLAVGAYAEASASNWGALNPADNSASNAGAVYVY